MEILKIVMSIICYVFVLIFLITEIININLYRKVKNKDTYKKIREEAKKATISKILYKIGVLMVILLAIYSLGSVVLSTLSLSDANYSQIDFNFKVRSFSKWYFGLFDWFICAVYVTAYIALIRAIYINKLKKFDLSILGKEHNAKKID